ncbi:MAG: dihydroorotate dehydrogenase B catalytic subunit [bacterium (Candidatus Stahlbacteria) CG23_combo_of_CG06-09_8_20_14_all_34_7]|nr:MAG: dihydroorotate dehydrogenase B catalytic subunit [bacterium (Candidatus Stahlbacteria) CG23_combo_of_CG06-09_8_20_14_all_34_7]
MINTHVKIGKTILKKPILGASGCSGWGEELLRFNDFRKIGGFVTKSITLKEKIGNEMPRIMETYGGLLNSIGLENKGVEYFIENILPKIKNFECAKFLNIVPFEESELKRMIEILDRRNGFDGYELNISCPNISNGDVSFNSSVSKAMKLIKNARKLTNKTLLLKLSPVYEASFEIAKMAEDAGFDGITFTNTYLGTAINIKERKFYFKNKQAGLSGGAIKPISLMNVYKMTKKVNIPIIAVGGIKSLDDVLEYLIIGASAVQIGTYLLIEPDILSRISEELTAYMEKEKINDISDIIRSLKE